MPTPRRSSQNFWKNVVWREGAVSLYRWIYSLAKISWMVKTGHGNLNHKNVSSEHPIGSHKISCASHRSLISANSNDQKSFVVKISCFHFPKFWFVIACGTKWLAAHIPFLFRARKANWSKHFFLIETIFFLNRLSLQIYSFWELWARVVGFWKIKKNTVWGPQVFPKRDLHKATF